MAKAQLDFSGARGIIDPLEGLRASMQQASTNLGQMIIQDENRVRQARQDARQDKQDLLATPGTPEWLAAKEAEKTLKMDSMAAEQKWKAEFDPVYQNALAVQKQSIVGSPEYNEAQKTLTKLEQDKKWFDWNNNPETKAKLDEINRLKTERAGQELLAKAIVGIPTEKMTSTTITPEQVQQTRVGLESAAVVNAGNVYNREFAKLRTPVTVSEPVLVEGYEVTPGKTAVMSEEEAHQEALKRAGLLDVVAGKAPAINEGLLPKVGVTESTKTLTAEELTQAKLNATIKAAQEGKVPAALALEVATKLTPVKTSKEKIDEAELVLKQQEFLEKQSKNYYGKSGGGSGKGDWLKTLEDTYKTYGTPDVIGEGQRAGIELKLSQLQSRENASDADMANAIESSRGVYAYPGGLGVAEDEFKEAVELNLLKILRDKKAKEVKTK